MTRLAHVAILPLTGLLLTGCVTPLAPEADQVRVTHNAADVAGYAAVGNLDPSADPRNQAVGLGGNVVFATNRFNGAVVVGAYTGVVYRCALTPTPVDK